MSETYKSVDDLLVNGLGDEEFAKEVRDHTEENKMGFQKYTSIENAYRQKYVNMIVENGFGGNTQYSVTEKIHGANLAFVFLGDNDPKIQKRKSLLGENASFYNVWAVYDKVIDGLTKMYKEDFHQSLEVRVFGELYGGKVQKGIFYKAEQDFYAFDIMVEDRYLDVEEKNNLFKKYDIPYAKELFKGNLEECLAYPNDFNSTMSDGRDNNTCEGTVISPYKVGYARGSRVILKNKNDKWSEKAKGKNPQVPTVIVLTEGEQKIFDEMFEMVTLNRVRNVVSKIGDINAKMFGMILGLTMKDIIEEWIKDNDGVLKEIGKSSSTRINKLINKEIANLIRPHIQDMIEGDF